jgi:isopenicillin N synthase-like dioxygenase
MAAPAAQRLKGHEEKIMSVEAIPIIDISRLDRPETLEALDRACCDWGFFQVVAHGIEPALGGRLLEAMRAFFGQPKEAKQRISRTAENPWGFYDRELTKNVLDWKEIYDYGPPAGPQWEPSARPTGAPGEGAAPAKAAAGPVPQWPQGLPNFRTAVLDFYAACEHLSFRLLGALSMNLGMPADHLAMGFTPGHTSFLRLNYYPMCPAPERPEGFAVPRRGHLGINHHTDAGALTILLQDSQPGLEVYRQGEWHLVTPRTNALVVNIGDIVQVWSNDRYQASLHRVIANASAERFSAPFFFNPAYETDYAPLPSTVSGRRPARYRPINWGEFRAGRAAGDYADSGEEIQIGRYRVEGGDHRCLT